MKVQSQNLSENLKNLFRGYLSKVWIQKAMDDLRAKSDSNEEGLGKLAADGGRPIDGMAPCLDPAGWESIVKSMFCTDD